jgi:FkbM family methyltransferase
MAELVSRIELRTGKVPVLSAVSSRLRRLLVAYADPLVRFRIGRFEVLLPLAHRLPLYRRAHPLYDTAIGRLAALVHEKYPLASVVDIGANVGDTAAVIRSESPAPLLCIEGEERFFALLEQNVRGLGRAVHLEKALVGAGASTMTGSLQSRDGTARVVSDGFRHVTFFPLEQILDRKPDLLPLGLVKIDTDGFDCPIVESNLGLWEKFGPVLFFEYDPAFYAGWNPLPMWNGLARAGYEQALVFENTGEYTLAVDLRDRLALEDLHARYTGWSHGRYADVAAFPSRDADLAAYFRVGEQRAWFELHGIERPPWMPTETR